MNFREYDKVPAFQVNQKPILLKSLVFNFLGSLNHIINNNLIGKKHNFDLRQPNPLTLSWLAIGTLWIPVANTFKKTNLKTQTNMDKSLIVHFIDLYEERMPHSYLIGPLLALEIVNTSI